MDTAQWPQTTCEKGGEKSGRAQKEQSGLKCPRCSSTNTKFCYYNNYSLSQPRYFCKTCRRYWTAGGTLRNIPVGGGTRKNKRKQPNDDDENDSSKMIDSKRVKLMGAPDPKTGIAIDGQDLDFGTTFVMMPPGYVGPTQDPASGFSTSLSFSLDGFGLGAGGSTFAFQDLRLHAPSTSGINGHDRDHEISNGGDGFWSGVLGGGGAW